MKSSLSRLSSAVSKLQRNRNGIKESEVPKYQKAFDRLEKSIIALHKEAFSELVLSGLFINMEEEDAISRAKKAMDNIIKEMGPQIRKQCREALLEKCNMDFYILVCLHVQCIFERRFYKEYWCKHTSIKAGLYYNDLIDMWYNASDRLWENADGYYSIYFPPTIEQYESDLNQREQKILLELKSA